MCERAAVNTLVLGIGNLLLSDEGIGVHVAQALNAKGKMKGVTVLDVGTAMLDVLPYIAEADRVIVVDAMKADGKAGSVYRLPLEDCLKKEYVASMHGFDFSRVIALSGRHKPVDVLVIGIEPSRIEWGMELSVELQEVFPEVLRIVEQEVAGYSSAIHSDEHR